MLFTSWKELICLLESGRLSSAETARRLGIKVETLYAYVSRGLLTPVRVPGGRGSSFAIRDVDRLARSGARPRARDTEPFRFPAISTGSTLIRAGRLTYRGESAVLLSAERSFEEVTSLLWDATEDGAWALPTATATAVRRAVRALPAAADLPTRLRVALATAAALDPLRHDLRPAAVRRTARLAIAGMVDGLASAAAGAGSSSGTGRPPGPVGRRALSTRPDTSLAERLAVALTPPSMPPPDPRLTGCIQASLVLLADHGLAVSTVAARVAASARADPYAVIGAGLGVLDSPLHGAASAAARALLTEIDAGGDPAAAVLVRLRAGHPVPGIGHPLYPSGDPRAAVLFARLAVLPDAGRWLAAARAVEQIVAGRGRGREIPDRANVDLALAVLTLAARMPADAGEAVFGVARAAGWIAHALEEYREEPLRWRGRDLYTGPEPWPDTDPSPHPTT